MSSGGNSSVRFDRIRGPRYDEVSVDPPVPVDSRRSLDELRGSDLARSSDPLPPPPLPIPPPVGPEFYHSESDEPVEALELKPVRRFIPDSVKNFFRGSRSEPQRDMPAADSDSPVSRGKECSPPASPSFDTRKMKTSAASSYRDPYGGSGSSYNSRMPMLPHDPYDSLDRRTHRTAMTYSERVEEYHMKYSYMKSWPGLLRILAIFELLLGAAVFACVCAYIHKDNEWFNMFGYRQPYDYGGSSAYGGYYYSGPKTPFILVVAGLAWLVTVILLVLGMTMYYRTILLDSHWWPLTEFGLNTIEALELKPVRRFIPDSVKNFFRGSRSEPQRDMPAADSDSPVSRGKECSPPASPSFDTRKMKTSAASSYRDPYGGSGSSYNSRLPMLPHDPYDSLDRRTHRTAMTYSERVEEYHMKYSYMKSWPGLLRILAIFELLLGAAVFACVCAYIHKDNEWFNMFGYRQPYDYGGSSAYGGYYYSGPKTPFILVVAGLAWLVTVILLVLGMTMYYRTILLDSHWWPLTEFGLNIALFILYLAAAIVYVNDANRGGLCSYPLFNNGINGAFCRVEGGQTAGMIFLFVTVLMYLVSAIVCLKLWRHEAARRYKEHREHEQGAVVGDGRTGPPAVIHKEFRPVDMKPGVLSGHIPAGHIPKPLVVPDYVAKYPSIKTDDERDRYKAVFNDQHSEYKELHAEVQAVLKKFTEMDSLMKKLPRFPENQMQGAVVGDGRTGAPAVIHKEFIPVDMKPGVLSGHIPAGHIPKPLVVPDYVAKYPSIKTDDERDRYKAVFNDQHSEYKELHAEVQAVLKKFTEMDSVMKKLPRFPENQMEHDRICNIFGEYEKKKNDPAFLEKKERCEYLKSKLSHIKQKIQEYDKVMGWNDGYST
ncbi:UNVERIFIED_CONTAM: hypothetical protein FKN15_070867 [Acipenser sinensis]